jgi:hypothetical protein
MSTEEEKPTEPIDPESVVSQHKFIEIMYENTPQELYLSRCVQKVFISKFYGSFTIFDQSGRELGKSKNGTLCFNESKLQTEAAKVWYEAISDYSDEYKELKKRGVKDIGLCFTCMNDVTIQFHDAPVGEDDPSRVFYHIPVYYTVHNIWNSETKMLTHL